VEAAETWPQTMTAWGLAWGLVCRQASGPGSEPSLVSGTLQEKEKALVRSERVAGQSGETGLGVDLVVPSKEWGTAAAW